MLDGVSKESDLVDELLRQVQKPLSGEKTPALGHADLHRVIKDMVKQECAGGQSTHFCKTLSGIVLKDFETHLSTRAVFIILALLENETTAVYLQKQVKAQINTVKAKAKAEPKSTGLQLLLKKLE